MKSSRPKDVKPRLNFQLLLLLSGEPGVGLVRMKLANPWEHFMKVQWTPLVTLRNSFPNSWILRGHLIPPHGRHQWPRQVHQTMRY